MRIDVIGAGPAGLIAARRAAQLGAQVRLFDRGEPGGMIQPATLLDGCTIDIGAEAFAVRGGAVAALIDELGLTDEVVAPRPLPSWGYANGCAYPMPRGGFMGIPSDADAVAHVLSERAIAAVRAEQSLDAHVGSEATTLAELIRARYDDEVLERLVAPVSRGVYSIDPHDVDLSAVLPGIATEIANHGSLTAVIGARRSSATPGALVNTVRGGMHRVIAALVRECTQLGVTIHTNTEIIELPNSDAADAVIVTVTPSAKFPWLRELAHTSGITAQRDAIEAAQLAASDTVAAEVVALAVTSPELDDHPRGTGVLVAASDAAGASGHTVRAKALTHASAKWQWLAEAAAPQHIVRLSYGPARGASTSAQPLTVAMADDELLTLARADATELLGVSQLEIVAHGRRIWRMPAPPTRVGRPALLEQVRRAIAAQDVNPRVYACGTWIDGTGLATVVPRAIATAEAAVAGTPAGH